MGAFHSHFPRLIGFLDNLHRGIADCMTINSGFAYYSLSSIFITEYRRAELGIIALLVNVIREMITLLDVGIGKRKRHDPSLSRSHARKYILRF